MTRKPGNCFASENAEHKNKLTKRAKDLRRRASNAEQLLWRHLRAKRMMGWKFRRQAIIGPYIVDFACFEAGLIIEADGGQHAEQAAYDAKRTAMLEGEGYRVLRFWNHEILTELEAVLERIRLELEGRPSPSGRGDGEG